MATVLVASARRMLGLLGWLTGLAIATFPLLFQTRTLATYPSLIAPPLIPPLMYNLQSSSSLSTDFRSQPASELKYTYDGLSTGSIGPSRAPYRIWKPRILRLPFIFSTVVLLLAIIAALEAFVRLSHLRSGFAVPADGVRRLLTYGPIVGFVCMGMVWKSWELEVKKLMPWADMRTKPIPAKDSILLDYVGVNYVEVLWIAVKHKHWSVLLAILGSGMLAISNIVLRHKSSRPA
ncbi:hypothetical protein EXIGLDRAFT_847756, partial [Exidia glandulosa HHB12029]